MLRNLPGPFALYYNYHNKNAPEIADRSGYEEERCSRIYLLSASQLCKCAVFVSLCHICLSVNVTV